jgi:hypothetical protein
LKFFLLLFGQFKILHTFVSQLNPTIMKNIILFLAATLGFQANAQLKSPEGIELNSKVALAFEGIELIKYEPGVYDYVIEGLNSSDSADYRAYKLYSDLGSACINATKIPKSDVTVFGYIFHFEECDVFYMSMYGGTLRGLVRLK